MIHATVLDTPIGPLALLAHEGNLVVSGFTADPREMHVRLPPALRSYELVEDSGEMGDIAQAHEAYFDGDLAALDTVPVRLHGSRRLERLWALLREVPPGQVLTYAELADRAGIERGARVAGAACARNLIAPAVPCHRVIPSTGGKGLKRLRGYYYGLERKDWLLRHEGVAITNDL